jgi:3-oxoacyl-[acyl-carrier protein] reductase
MSERFKGKVAIVTGGGHGIGAAIVDRLASEGAAVLICDLRRERAEAKAEAIKGRGGRAVGAPADVRVRSDIESAVARAASDLGRLDVLVNAAGIMDRAPFLEMDDDLWRRVIDTNLYGTFICCQAVAREMIAAGKGGAIVNIASGSGILGGQGRGAYGASKAGVINLTQTMGIELAAAGIRVNAIAPGPVKTRPEQGATLGPSVAARMPMKRFGRPEEIAAMAAFLASDEASFTTGHTFVADGGLTITGILEG